MAAFAVTSKRQVKIAHQALIACLLRPSFGLVESPFAWMRISHLSQLELRRFLQLGCACVLSVHDRMHDDGISLPAVTTYVASISASVRALIEMQTHIRRRYCRSCVGR